MVLAECNPRPCGWNWDAVLCPGSAGSAMHSEVSHTWLCQWNGGKGRLQILIESGLCEPIVPVFKLSWVRIQIETRI